MEATLRQMIELNDIRGIEMKLDSDPSLATAYKGYDQLIHTAAGNNKSDIVELLLKRGADVDAVDQDGKTPLHRAAQLGPETVRVLLNNGANPNIYDENGYSPIAWAIFGQQREGKSSVELLLNAGARCGLLEAASMGDYAKVLQILSSDPRSLIDFPSQEVLLTMAFLDGLFVAFPNRARIVLLFLERGIRVTPEYLRELASISQSLGYEDLAKTIVAYRPPI